jgi:hypothetical protein
MTPAQDALIALAAGFLRDGLAMIREAQGLAFVMRATEGIGEASNPMRCATVYLFRQRRIENLLEQAADHQAKANACMAGIAALQAVTITGLDARAGMAHT